MQDEVDAKLPYESPQLTEYGTVTELTDALGMTFQTDSTFAGSMEPMGKSG